MADTDLDLTSEPPEGQAPEGIPAPASEKQKRPRRKRPRAFRIAVKILIAVVILWVAGAAVITILGIRDASRAMRDLQLAKSELSATQVVSSEPDAALESARQEFSAASSWFDSPLLTPAVVV